MIKHPELQILSFLLMTAKIALYIFPFRIEGLDRLFLIVRETAVDHEYEVEWRVHLEDFKHQVYRPLLAPEPATVSSQIDMLQRGQALVLHSQLV